MQAGACKADVRRLLETSPADGISAAGEEAASSVRRRF